MPKLKRMDSMSWVAPSFFGNENQNSSGSSKKVCISNEKLWVDEFPPKDPDELAVNKKKVSEFFDIFQQTLHTVKKKRILLLTGPSGCGKTSTVKTVCKELGVTIREWRNPSIHKYEAGTDREEYISQVDQFVEFTSRSSKYNSVCQTEASHKGRYTVLIEELPNIFIYNPLEFHPILRKLSNSKSANPIIFILSDINGQDTLQRSLFPHSLQSELSISNISFNPIAATLMMSAINRVVSLVSKSLTEFATPPKEVITAIVEGCNGDIRNAVNSLQFILRKSHFDSVLSNISKPKTSRTQKGKKKKEQRTMLSETIFSGCRDSSLAVFRALGKILYCKRDPDEKDNLPLHLKINERYKLIENPDLIFEKTAMESPSKFCLFVHHNCPSFYDSVGDLAAALECIGDCDIISSYWTMTNSLEAYSSSLAIRGVMFSLNSDNKCSFKQLGGPQWFTHQRTLNERRYKLRNYRKSGNLSEEEMAVNVLPFVCKINGLMHNPEETNLLREIGIYNYKNRSGFDTTNNCFEDQLDSSISSFQNDNLAECIMSTISNRDDPEEDFFIEEYID